MLLLLLRILNDCAYNIRALANVHTVCEFSSIGMSTHARKSSGIHVCGCVWITKLELHEKNCNLYKMVKKITEKTTRAFTKLSQNPYNNESLSNRIGNVDAWLKASCFHSAIVTCISTFCILFSNVLERCVRNSQSYFRECDRERERTHSFGVDKKNAVIADSSR